MQTNNPKKHPPQKKIATTTISNKQSKDAASSVKIKGWIRLTLVFVFFLEPENFLKVLHFTNSIVSPTASWASPPRSSRTLSLTVTCDFPLRGGPGASGCPLGFSGEIVGAALAPPPPLLTLFLRLPLAGAAPSPLRPWPGREIYRAEWPGTMSRH